MTKKSTKKPRERVLYLDPNSRVGAPVIRSHEQIVDELEQRIAELEAELATTRADRDDAQRRAEMACENPDPQCGCCGCQLADERAKAGEL